MKIDIEDIKALEPGKIYAVSLDMRALDAAQSSVETLSDIGRDLDLKFIFLMKGSAELISAPEGMKVSMVGVTPFQLMEKEMIAYLEKAYDFDAATPETILVAELRRIFLENKTYGAKHCEAFSAPKDWPNEVSVEELLSIVENWEIDHD